MPSGPWTDEENGRVVADYFAMLADDLAAKALGNKVGKFRAM